MFKTLGHRKINILLVPWRTVEGGMVYEPLQLGFYRSNDSYKMLIEPAAADECFLRVMVEPNRFCEVSEFVNAYKGSEEDFKEGLEKVLKSE